MRKTLMLAGIAGIFIFASCQNQKESKKEEAKFLVTSPVKIDTLFYKEYVGQVQSSSHIELRSQERGYLQKIFVDEGQFVKKGQLMFQIMPLLYQAEKQKAAAEVDFADIEYKNTKSLTDKNIVSLNELAMAKAKLNKAKAELSLAQAHLSLTEVRAPFDGIMDRFHERLGSLIEEGALLTTLSNNNKMWVYFNVPESEYLDYATRKNPTSNQIVQLQMANSQIFEHNGIVETIEADFNNETGNIAFRATFPNPKGVLRHGETGNIMMPIALKNAILIPQKATFDVLDKKYVYVVDKDGVLKATQITVAHEIPHLYVISAGISPKDKILAEGLGKVKNNEKIKYDFISFAKELVELNNLHAE
jgi:membrane fusion protein (multidrug efflux system)